jgi:trimeric autotransporter adhesin
MNGAMKTCARAAVVASLLACTCGCSNWVLDVVKSFGSPNGPRISTIAGNGAGGYAGDGGPATAASISQPYGVAADSSGNIYIADSHNNRIRRVDASGTITTVATGLNGPVGIAVDPSTGDVYFSDTSAFVIRKNGAVFAGTLNARGFDGTHLDYPYGVAVHPSGDVYFAQMAFSSVIRKVSGGVITTVAGNGSPGYSGDGGPATSASLNYPEGVAVDSAGNLYIADSSNYVIRKVTPGGTISTIAGTGISGYSGDGGPATAAQINFPSSVAVDSSGNLYITEGDNVVRKVDTSGIISTVAGNIHLAGGYGGDGNVATAATLNAPWGLAFDTLGNLLIGDRLNNRIRKVALGR